MKEKFDLRKVLSLIEDAIRPFPKAAMFELSKRGYDSLFEQLISCVVSIRTLDETTIPVSLRLFAEARTPQEVVNLGPERLTTLLYGSTYPEQKTNTILGIAKAAVEEYAGELPADFTKLTALKGVGPKCANLALGVAAGHQAISVDVHVHRVVNRWGYVDTKQPEQSLKVLEQKVPIELWTEINRLLMPFGKHICTGNLPKCSTCPVLPYCEQVGVTKHR
ncbi:endonuclease III domain-containing protein [Persicitalea jodogahamensis]|uniref:Endonuclease III n=1 Tax=Persicitalea jodogahamensis TaxID=402147 RepID=A0A8J3D8I4_9BACT|nr:endonuclease III [Persicitalea jodogahamensis]GHB76339.1 endonuclease III [Persicitalea jodogahamensis]